MPSPLRMNFRRDAQGAHITKSKLRCTTLQTVVEDIEQTVEQLPPDVQGALIAPLATLHAQLCGLMYVALLFAQTHLHADDHNQ